MVQAPIKGKCQKCGFKTQWYSEEEILKVINRASGRCPISKLLNVAVFKQELGLKR